MRDMRDACQVHRDLQAQLRPVVLGIKICLHKLASSLNYSASETKDSSADAEGRQVLTEAAQSFVGTIEFYKTEHGGARSHDDAVKEALENHEWRRRHVAALLPQEVTWGDLAAVGDVDTDDALQLWARLREAADDELECGKRGATVAGENTNPYSLAQYLAIRDSFADQWQPQGGIESAMIDMLTMAFSLQMHWSKVAHERVTRTQLHNAISEASSIAQAHVWKLSLLKQFLRVVIRDAQCGTRAREK